MMICVLLGSYENVVMAPEGSALWLFTVNAEERARGLTDV